MTSQLAAKAAKIINTNVCKTTNALSRLDSVLSLHRQPTAEEWSTWIATCRDIAAEAKAAANEACDWSEALVADTAA